MADRIAHRGPDNQGVWLDAQRGLALAHRRLSILDLSPAGHQPMLSASGRWVIIFNGEIYNHLGIRRELNDAGRAPAWRGHSDTETLTAGFDAWGIEATLRKTIGMFALAVWDRQQLTLTLARDRFGEKPLYYGWQGDTFLFGSELKALAAHPAFHAEVDRGALTLLLRHNYIPAPHSIFEGICKLPPATTVSVRADGRDGAPQKYWSAAEAMSAGIAKPFRGSPGEAVEALEQLLGDAVAQQMLSDVPLGAFLSGGVDSSTIVALMQARSSTPVKTFTIGFNEEVYNEAEYARSVARYFGTDHTELYVSPQEALNVIPLLPQLYDEPFADPSQIPTFLVSRLARGRVTVSLSGDAGDELFGGYDRYVLAPKLWQQIGYVPTGLRRLVSTALASLSPATWDTLVSPLSFILPRNGRRYANGGRLHRAAALLRSGDEKALYARLMSYCADPAAAVIDGPEAPSTLTAPAELPAPSYREYMMAVDTISYLPDDILVKVDRAAMGVSLETRAPYLDHRVFEFAWSLPLSLKFRDGQTKWALRQVLYRHLPRTLVDRPKMGFGVPVDTWLRGPLRDWAEDMLTEQRLRQEGYLQAAPIREKWMEHQSGRRNWQYHLWGVLMFQAWARELSISRLSRAPAAEGSQGKSAVYASEQELSQL
jgi:asparagine synthase (glutamine-hydrolysing)